MECITCGGNIGSAKEDFKHENGHCVGYLKHKVNELVKENDNLYEELEESARLHDKGATREAKLLAEVSQLKTRSNELEANWAKDNNALVDALLREKRAAGRVAQFEKESVQVCDHVDSMCCGSALPGGVMCMKCGYSPTKPTAQVCSLCDENGGWHKPDCAASDASGEDT